MRSSWGDRRGNLPCMATVVPSPTHASLHAFDLRCSVSASESASAAVPRQWAAEKTDEQSNCVRNNAQPRWQSRHVNMRRSISAPTTTRTIDETTPTSFFAERRSRSAKELRSALSAFQIPLESSRHVSTRHDTFDVSSASRRACPAVLSTSTTQPKCMGSTRRTCHVVTRRDVTSQVEFGLHSVVVHTLHAVRKKH